MKRIMLAMISVALLAFFCVGCSSKATPQVSEKESAESSEQTFEIKDDIRILVPFAAGGAVDVKARTVAEAMEAQLGVKVSVENITGGGGSICASQFVAQDDPNTVLFTTSTVFTLSPLVTNVSFTYEDVLPLAALDGEAYGLYTCPEKSGLKTFDDVVAYGENNEIIFGSGGPTTNLHIMQAALYKELGFAFNTLPHSGAKEGLTNIMGGHSDITMAGLETARDFVAEGMVEPVLVFLDEAYTGYEGYEVPSVLDYVETDLALQGISFFFVNKDLPTEVASALQAAIKNAIAEPNCKETIQAMNGIDWTAMTTEEAMEYMKAENELFTTLLK